jgi:hypothetical protein
MIYIQKNLEINFLEENKTSGEWYSSRNFYKGIELDFFFNISVFKFNDSQINWETIKIFTEHILDNLEFINLKGRKWTKDLYNGIGFKLDQTNNFEDDNGFFKDYMCIKIINVNWQNPIKCKYEVRFSIESTTGREMDCYHDYEILFTNEYGNACFLGAIRK